MAIFIISGFSKLEKPPSPSDLNGNELKTDKVCMTYGMKVLHEDWEPVWGFNLCIYNVRKLHDLIV